MKLNWEQIESPLGGELLKARGKDVEACVWHKSYLLWYGCIECDFDHRSDYYSSKEDAMEGVETLLKKMSKELSDTAKEMRKMLKGS